MKFKIPKKINLLDSQFKIKKVKNLQGDNGDYYGLTQHCDKTIHIAEKVNGVKVSDKELEITVMHEIIHAILGDFCFLDENNNEALVECLAKNIVKINKQIYV